VPDSAAQVAAENGQVALGDAPLVINPWDEYAVEAALAQQEKVGGSVTALSVGGESAKDALKHALAMGCSEAVLVSDPALRKADSQAVARVLAAAVGKLASAEPVGLVFFGRQAIDGDLGVTHAQTARLLGWPMLGFVALIQALDPSAGTIRVERSLEEGRQGVEARLPAVVSVVKDIGEPRYPSFMGIRKAARADIPVWTLADLGISPPTARVEWPEVVNPPVRQGTVEMITGGSPQEIAAKLVDKVLAEKVL
jgi:electron transfer flavoprotein beta subunit